LVDEARLVSEDVIEEVLSPMTKTRRPNIIRHRKKIGVNVKENGKMIYISSAYLKSCDLYKRFKYHYQSMISGSSDYFCCAIPWEIGVKDNIMDEDDILKEKDKPTMTADKFTWVERSCVLYKKLYSVDSANPFRGLQVIPVANEGFLHIWENIVLTSKTKKLLVA